MIFVPLSLRSFKLDPGSLIPSLGYCTSSHVTEPIPTWCDLSLNFKFYCMASAWILNPELCFLIFLNSYRRKPRTPLIRSSVRLSVRPSVRLPQNQSVGSNNRLAGCRLAKTRGRRPDALPAGLLVGFSAGCRLQINIIAYLLLSSSFSRPLLNVFFFKAWC